MKYVEVKENNKWLLKHKKTVLEDLVENGFMAIEEYKDFNEEKLDKLLLKRFKKMSECYESCYNTIREQVELEVLNGTRELIEKNIIV